MTGSLLACPDRLNVAWLHVFAAADPPGPCSAWNSLWPEARVILTRLGVPAVWAMTVQDWMLDLLMESGFAPSGRVVTYTIFPPHVRPDSGRASVRPLTPSDLPDVERLDHDAFSPPWQMDSEALHATLARSALAVVYSAEDRIAGYLMAAASPRGVHLTRLAVHPLHQRRGIGRALLLHLLDCFHRRGAPRITVNTQIENRPSQHLYHSLGFRETDESYPVFRIDLRSG
jgi:ribosomal protein S18 acetylase RimI-like enzyme